MMRHVTLVLAEDASPPALAVLVMSLKDVGVRQPEALE
jgi:hypothetical protein